MGRGYSKYFKTRYLTIQRNINFLENLDLQWFAEDLKTSKFVSNDFATNALNLAKKYPLTNQGYFGKRGKGSNKVREIITRTPIKTTKDFFDSLVGNLERRPLIQGTKSKNQQTVKFPDGTRINKRITTSSKGSPAIDIFIVSESIHGIKTQKIHFVKGEK